VAALKLENTSDRRNDARKDDVAKSDSHARNMTFHEKSKKEKER